ncbi:MAG: thioredoxin family protein [Chitinophagales bacterium]
MKKFSLLFIALVSIFTAFAQDEEGIDFFHGTFEEAKALAEEEGKLIFMDAYATWCGPCKRMAANVFPLKSVGDFYNRNFINLKMDMEKGEGKDLAKTYGVSAYPTLIFIDSEGEVVYLTKGARDEAGLLAVGKQALLPNQALIDELQAQWDNGDTEPAFLKSWIKVQAVLNENYDEPMKLYVDQLSTEDKINDDNVAFLFDYANHVNSPALAVIYDFEDYYKDIYAEKYDEKLQDIAKGTFNKAVTDKDESLLREAQAMLKKIKADNYKEQSAIYEVTYYGKVKDWENYDKTVTSFLKKYKKDDDAALRNVAWNYYMYIDDESKLEKAEKWTQDAIAINNNYENNLSQAYLLYKLKQYSEAQDAIEYALILAEEDQKKKDNAQMLYDNIYSKLEEMKTE